jgi:hypothetical protein
MATARDHDFEREFLKLVARKAPDLLDQEVDLSYFPAAVRKRLKLGKRHYGDDAFLSKDNLSEALEETADTVAYAVLELQRLGPERPEGVTGDLLQASILAALADFSLRSARRRLRDEKRDEK